MLDLSQFQNEYGFVFLSAIFVIIFVAWLSFQINKCFSKNMLQQTFELLLKIVSDDDTLLLSLITVPGLPEDYLFQANDSIQNIKVTGCFFENVTYEWPSVKITHRDLGTEHRLPGTANLCFGQASLVRKILNTRFACFPAFKINEVVVRMSLAYPQSDQTYDVEETIFIE